MALGREIDEAVFWDAMAENYFSKVISPFSTHVKFSLFSDLDDLIGEWRKVHALKNKVGIDFGCGVGYALKKIAGKLGLSIGIDFSESMLRKCLKTLRKNAVKNGLVDGIYDFHNFHERLVPENNTRKTLLFRGDLRDLSKLRNRCDLGICVNSIVAADVVAADRLFSEICSAIRKNGFLFSVLPAFDAMEHLFSAINSAGNRSLDVGTIDVDACTFKEKGITQFYFRPRHIKEMAAKNQLKIIKIEKIHYPWSLIKKFGWGNFTESEELWDWYVVSQRIS